MNKVCQCYYMPVVFKDTHNSNISMEINLFPISLLTKCLEVNWNGLLGGTK